jgi:four helix bundle protein
MSKETKEAAVAALPPVQKVATFEDLYVYRLAREARKELTDLALSLPEDERFNLRSQIRRAALSVTNNIAEGYGRFHFQENVQFCRQARGSLYELVDDLTACLDCGYISADQEQELKQRVYSVIKVLNNYIASIRRQRSKIAS